MSASYDPLASPIDGVTLKFIELTNGIRLRVAFAGEEKGTPLLFMHGWPESWFSWRHQLQYFHAADLGTSWCRRSYRNHLQQW